MKREEKKKLKAQQIQQELLDQTFKENFSVENSKYMMQPYEMTMMKGRRTLVQDTIYESIQLEFQDEYQDQLNKRMKKSKEHLGLWEEPMEPIKVYFNKLGVRPDCYDEVQRVALEMAKQVVDVETVDEHGETIVNYMPVFSKISVPVVTFEEINRSENAESTPYKNNKRRKGYIEFVINPAIGPTLFEITSMYTKFIPGAGKKCKCCHSPTMYRWSAHWRDIGGRWEFDYISFRRLLGLREVVPVVKDGKTTYEEVDSVYPDFGEVKRFVLDKAQKDVKDLADKNQFDCYFTYELVMPIKSNGKRATRGNPEKIIFHSHLSELGRRMREHNNSQMMSIRLEQMLMKEFRMSKQSAAQLTAKVTDEIRVKFSNKMMDLLTYVINPSNGVKDRGGYAFMALSNYLDEITPYAEEVVPEYLPTLDNKQEAEKVQSVPEKNGADAKNSADIPSKEGYSEESLPNWWRVLDFIRERMAKELFDIHILPLYPASFDGSKLTISAPNEYIFKEVQIKYAPRLLEIIRERFGEGTEVIYTIGDTYTSELIKRYEARFE